MDSHLQQQPSVPMSSKEVKDEDRPSENWPDRKLMETALRHYLKNPQIKVLDFRSRMATNAGDNYTSNMYRVTVKCEQRNEPLSIIIKRLISSGSSGDLFMNSTLFAREEEVLGRILPEIYTVLKKIIPEVEPFGAHFVYATPGVLMMEDLLPGGFRMADRRSGLDLNHCSLVLRTLAYYHAASVYLMEKKFIDLSLFRKSMFGEPQNKKYMEKFCNGMVRTLSEEVKNFDGLEKYSAKLSAIADKDFLSLVEKALEEHEDGDLLVLAHGDLWLNNMMFRYSSSGALDGIRFVDYQLACITSPAADVNFFLATSCNQVVRTTCMDQLVEEYHETLCKTMLALGCSTPPPTIEQFQKDRDKCIHYSMFGAFNILPMMLAEPGEFDFNDVVTTGKLKGVLFRKDYYKKALQWLLPMYESKGFL